MASRMFIAGEWGSVAMRLNLCRVDGDDMTIIATAEGGGVVGCNDFESAFFAAAGPWFEAHGALPVVLAGMIGSNIGWCNSDYAACPAGIDDIAANLTTLHVCGVNIHFTPGLKCHNIFGLPDIIRGEEMQILGWLRQNPAPGQRLICLPGRHVKWLLTEGDRIISFFTGMTGELEDLLLTHGLLAKGIERATESQAGFLNGLRAISNDPSLSLAHALFSTRGRLILGEHSAQEAASYLKGLLVSADIRDSLSAHTARDIDTKSLVLFDHGPAGAAYSQALVENGIAFEHVNAPLLAVTAMSEILANGLASRPE